MVHISHLTQRTIPGEIPRDRSRYCSEKLFNKAVEIAPGCDRESEISYSKRQETLVEM